MVETITPVVHGGSRRRWARSVAAHTLGAVLGAAFLGAALGGIGVAVGAPWTGGWVVVVAAALVYSARELGVRVPVPQLRRQVPEWWRRSFPPAVSSFLYGVVLGTGYGTHLRHGTLVVASAVAVAGGSPLAGALIVAPFGMARGLSLAVTWGSTSGAGASRAVEALERWSLRPWIPWIHVTAMAGAGVAVAMNGAVPTAADVLRAGGFVLAMVLAWAGLAKAIRPRAWDQALGGYALPGGVQRVARWGVPAVELVVAGALVFGPSRPAAAAATALLAVFTAAIVRARRRLGRRLPCGCFGGRRTRDARAVLARNVSLLLLALAVAMAGPSGALAGRLHAPTTEELLPAALVMVAAGIALSLLRAAARLLDPA